MRLNVQHFSVRSTNALDSWVERQLLALGQMRQIDEANVRLEHHHEASPPYHVRVHLVTPGPDVFVESCDHTLRAAFAKAIAELNNNLLGRARQRLQKARTNLATRSLKASLARAA